MQENAEQECVCVCVHFRERQKEGGGEERKIMTTYLPVSQIKEFCEAIVQHNREGPVKKNIVR